MIHGSVKLYFYLDIGFSTPLDVVHHSPAYDRGSTETRLEVMTTNAVSQEQLYKLLDLIPGMDYCDFDRHACQFHFFLDSNKYME